MVTYFIPRPKTRPAPPAINHRTNCPNCCAVITGPICEYCGTRFIGADFAEQEKLITTTGEEVIIPIYIGNEHLTDVIRKNDPRFRSGGV